ncbi:MAG: ABC transporter permease [Actinobacteria bacterium]|nr:ABC transporter permease [Actinomycetota bacterium]
MVIVVATFTFFVIRLMPGDPIAARYEELLLRGVPPDQARAQVQGMYGFLSDDPLHEQYPSYLWQLLQLDLGKSISYEGVPVSKLITTAAPYTVILVLSGLVVSFLIGVVAGALAAVRRASRLGDLLTISGSLLHGIPQFVIALFLAYLFTTIWTIFPYGAPYDATIAPGLSFEFIQSLVVHAVLPVAAYALASYGGWMLTMKSSVVSVLGDDFVLAAELRGLTLGLRLRYIARNAILPLFTIFALSIGFMFGGSVFIEDVFDYPGLGKLLLDSIKVQDYPLMGGAFVLITTAVIIANIFADILYTVIDPRVRT